MLKKIFIGLLGVSLIGLVIYGCGQVVEKPTETGSLLIKVKRIDGYDLSGVSVSVTGVSGAKTTNLEGYVAFIDVPVTDRAIINFSKDDHVSTTRITSIRKDVESYVETRMAQASAPTVLTAENGGTASQPGNTNATVTITGGTLRDASGNVVTGDVNVGVNAFDPTDVDQRAAFPGNFAGVVNGQEQPFKSFGFMDATVTQNGQDLNIGSTAQIEIPIPAAQAASASDTMDAWYFDADQGKWIQDGVFTKVDKGGGEYVYRKDVTHFSTWNADYLYEQAYKKGRVVDEEGNPVEGATVIVEGEGWQNETVTDSNGEYIVEVEPNSSITEYARKGTLVSDTSSPETSPPTGETETYPDLVLTTPLVTITLIWGEDPPDLDSHITGPTPEAETERFHIWYGNESQTGSYTSLDIDVTSSYGPEHIVITKFLITADADAVYRYAVHNFSGNDDGLISNSGARVRLDIPSAGISGRMFTPPSGQPMDKDVWRVFDLKVDPSENVTVQALNDYADSLDPKDAYFTSSAVVSGAGASKKKK